MAADQELASREDEEQVSTPSETSKPSLDVALSPSGSTSGDGQEKPLQTDLDDTADDARIKYLDPSSPDFERKIVSEHFTPGLFTKTAGDIEFKMSLHRLGYQYNKDADSTELLTACFTLAKLTSFAHYKYSSIGWNDQEKLDQMLNKNMWTILTTYSEVIGNPRHYEMLGYLSFMLDYDEEPFEDRPILYIYELHVTQTWRGFGIGTQLLKKAEAIARTVGYTKTMLTVFTANEKARRIYEKNGYTRDQSSKPDRVTRGRVIEPDQIIMSKDWRNGQEEIQEGNVSEGVVERRKRKASEAE